MVFKRPGIAQVVRHIKLWFDLWSFKIGVLVGGYVDLGVYIDWKQQVFSIHFVSLSNTEAEYATVAAALKGVISFGHKE